MQSGCGSAANQGRGTSARLPWNNTNPPRVELPGGGEGTFGYQPTNALGWAVFSIKTAPTEGIRLNGPACKLGAPLRQNRSADRGSEQFQTLHNNRVGPPPHPLPPSSEGIRAETNLPRQLLITENHRHETSEETTTPLPTPKNKLPFFHLPLNQNRAKDFCKLVERSPIRFG